MTLKRTFSQRLQIIFISLFIIIMKLRFRWSSAKGDIAKKMAAGRTPEMRRKIFANYEPTKHDVFVLCFSKSGTNWMMQIAQQIAYYGDAEFKHIHDLVAWPGASPTVVPLNDPTPQQKSPTGLRIIKSHEQSDYIPYRKEATYLIVVRDPKEVFVSAYHFRFGFLSPEEMLSVEEMYDLLVKENFFIMGDWAAHVHGYWQWRDRPNVLILTYRDLKMDPRGCTQRVAEVMGVPLTTVQLEEVVAKSDIAYMKKMGFAFSPPMPKIPTFGKENAPVILRKGQINSADELLTAAQKDAIDDHWRARLAELGSDFPYDELFVTNRSRIVNTN